MGTMSGAVQSQLVTALKYLQLMSDNHVPTEDMKRLVVAEDVERTKLMKALIIKHYPFVFGGDFDFATATGSMLQERFEEHTGASGETVTRCIAFLKDAAQDAGIAVSPFLSHKKGNGAGRKKPASTNSRKTDRTPGADTPGESHEPAHPHGSPIPKIEAQDSL